LDKPLHVIYKVSKLAWYWDSLNLLFAFESDRRFVCMRRQAPGTGIRRLPRDGKHHKRDEEMHKEKRKGGCPERADSAISKAYYG
jgi:hypothetical protein